MYIQVAELHCVEPCVFQSLTSKMTTEKHRLLKELNEERSACIEYKAKGDSLKKLTKDHKDETDRITTELRDAMSQR